MDAVKHNQLIWKISQALMKDGYVLNDQAIYGAYLAVINKAGEVHFIDRHEYWSPND